MGWNTVSTFVEGDLETFGASWIRRVHHDVMRPLLLGLEHFVRRALILAALALAPPPPVRSRSRNRRGHRKTRAASTGGFSVFTRRRTRKRRRRGRRYLRQTPALLVYQPVDEAEMRRQGRALRAAVLAADPLERRSPPAETDAPVGDAPAGPPGPPVRALPAKPARGLARRIAALFRVLSQPERHALRLRRRIDRARAARSPLILAPWPRDAFGRRIWQHDTLALQWPGAEAEILAALPPDTS